MENRMSARLPPPPPPPPGVVSLTTAPMQPADGFPAPATPPCRDRDDASEKRVDNSSSGQVTGRMSIVGNAAGSLSTTSHRVSHASSHLGKRSFIYAGSADTATEEDDAGMSVAANAFATAGAKDGATVSVGNPLHRDSRLPPPLPDNIRVNSVPPPQYKPVNPVSNPMNVLLSTKGAEVFGSQTNTLSTPKLPPQNQNVQASAVGKYATPLVKPNPLSAAHSEKQILESSVEMTTVGIPKPPPAALPPPPYSPLLSLPPPPAYVDYVDYDNYDDYGGDDGYEDTGEGDADVPMEMPEADNGFGMSNPLHVAKDMAAAQSEKVEQQPPRHRHLMTPAAVRYAESEARSEQALEKAVPKLPGPPSEHRPPWRPASLTIATAFQDDHHPRIVDSEGRKRRFKVCGSRLGRYWCLCCRCCDPCCEGVVSDLAQFGPGITSYFKTLKSLVWIFVFMSVLCLPAMALNLWGRKTGVSLNDLGLFETTIGNMDTDLNKTEVYIPFTSCAANGNGVGVAHYIPCSLPKDFVALLYSSADVLGMLVLLAGFLWIKFSSRSDAKLVKNAVVTAEKFTVIVSKIPRDTSETALATHFTNVTGYKVAEVFVAEDENHLINLFVKRGRLVKQLEATENAIWKYTTLQKPRIVSKYRKRRDRLVKAIRGISDVKADAQHGRGAILAFVTFEEEEGWQKALRMFPTSWIRRQFMSKALYFTAAGGKAHNLLVEPAPPPSVLLWENLGVARASRLFRRLITFLFSLLLLVVSSAFIYLASVKAEDFMNSQRPQNCPPGVSLTDATNDDSLVPCYCAGLSTESALSESICASWLKAQGVALAIQNLASLVIALVNAVLEFALIKLTRFEKHRSVDKMQLSFGIRLFIVQLINTAFLSLILTAEIPYVPGAAIRFSDFDPGWYSSVGVSIIVTMLINIVAPHLSTVFAYVRISCYRWVRGPHGARSQRELNFRYLGPEFDLSTRYAQLLNTLAASIIYSTGMPILIPIAALQFFITYWIDKWLFLRLYRTPPTVGITLGETMLEFIPICVILHAAFGFWMLTNPIFFNSRTIEIDEISRTTDSLQVPFMSRIKQFTSIPLVLLFIGLVVVTFLRGLLLALMGMLSKCLVLVSRGRFSGRCDCSGCCSASRRKKPFEKPLSFNEARIQRKLVGIPSYNILLNPRFMQAFAITKSFAMRHRRVADVFKDDGIDMRNRIDIDLGGASMRVLNVKAESIPK